MLCGFLANSWFGMSTFDVARGSARVYLKGLPYNCRFGTSAAKQFAGKLHGASFRGAQRRGIPHFAGYNSRGIPRFARNDGVGAFFRKLFSRDMGAGSNRGFRVCVTTRESLWVAASAAT